MFLAEYGKIVDQYDTVLYISQETFKIRKYNNYFYSIPKGFEVHEKQKFLNLKYLKYFN